MLGLNCARSLQQDYVRTEYVKIAIKYDLAVLEFKKSWLYCLRIGLKESFKVYHDSSVVGIQLCSDTNALRLKCKVQGLKVCQATVKELIQLCHNSSFKWNGKFWSVAIIYKKLRGG